MRAVIINLAVAVAFLAVGVGVGVCFGPQLKSTPTGLWITSTVAKAEGQDSDDNPFESYEYPTLKWKPKKLSDGPDSIGRLWTTFEPGANADQPGTLKYKLTLFKATKKDQREIQLLDQSGFKLLQFDAADFHDIPGAPDVVEARDSVSTTEALYKKARDFSIK